MQDHDLPQFGTLTKYVDEQEHAETVAFLMWVGTKHFAFQGKDSIAVTVCAAEANGKSPIYTNVRYDLATQKAYQSGGPPY